MKQRNLTYRLRTNAMQFAYLQNEVQKTRRLYLTLCKEVVRHATISQKGQVPFSRKEVAQKLRTELKYTNMTLYQKESETIIDKVLDYQQRHAFQQVPAFYVCEQFSEHLYWRGLNLQKLVQIDHFWQREPLYFHWEIIYSALFYRHHHFYLIVHFKQYS